MSLNVVSRESNTSMTRPMSALGGINKVITIGIQARSTSSRFPNKVHESIGGKTIIQRIVDSCNDSAKYLNRHAYKNGFIVNVALCCPTGDIIASKYSGQVNIIEGSETDVLSRYEKMANALNSDYIARVTADCPLIPSYVISSVVMKAIHNDYDYISNVEPRCRTAPDGWDCEVISRRLLDHASKMAIADYDREHVTTWIRGNPQGFKHGVVVNHIDLSGIKFSVDTPEEYERVVAEYEAVQNKLSVARQIFGEKNTHRL